MFESKSSSPETAHNNLVSTALVLIMMPQPTIEKYDQLLQDSRLQGEVGLKNGQKANDQNTINGLGPQM